MIKKLKAISQLIRNTDDSFNVTVLKTNGKKTILDNVTECAEVLTMKDNSMYTEFTLNPQVNKESISYNIHDLQGLVAVNNKTGEKIIYSKD